MSYVHTQWMSESSLKKVFELDIVLKKKVNKFDALLLPAVVDEEDAFPPEYVMVDRIIDETDERERDHKQYLVKWQGLPYSLCTWEYFSDFKDSAKVDEFERNHKVPTAARRKQLTSPVRPAITTWTKAEESLE
jgi:hypothetical protein